METPTFARGGCPFDQESQRLLARIVRSGTRAEASQALARVNEVDREVHVRWRRSARAAALPGKLLCSLGAGALALCISPCLAMAAPAAMAAGLAWMMAGCYAQRLELGSHDWLPSWAYAAYAAVLPISWALAWAGPSASAARLSAQAGWDAAGAVACSALLGGALHLAYAARAGRFDALASSEAGRLMARLSAARMDAIGAIDGRAAEFDAMERAAGEAKSLRSEIGPSGPGAAASKPRRL